ncbi:hypothetical protein HHK36_013147 [Tetracentron sinense]|uniref:Uncharacterized protein n=1 Tax=Tetracentron sinense TaxID=13715 RepID=A0A834ZA60_TETSI|nr:hypothetical protein HHK36_013147 [Tetracentron sinense]
MASVTASETLLIRNPNPSLSSLHHRPPCSNHVSFSLLSSPKPRSSVLHRPKPYNLRSTQKLRVSASSTSPEFPTKPSKNTIFAIIFSVSKLFADAIRGFSLKIRGIFLNPTPEELATIQKIRGNLVYTVGPLFFAALRDRPSGYLNTPLTVVASGMAKWLDIYSGVLMVRVLLSWFPNIPWDRQPLSAIRDLCDPYLNLFRNIIPPIFDTLDVSPLLAFAVLGTLGSILNNSRGAY